MVLQYGYLVLFASAWPLVFVMSLLDNLVVIRVDAWRQCAVMRRPDVYLAEDVGMWTDIMDSMTVLGIYFNVAIFCWTGNSLGRSSVLTKTFVFLVSSQVLLAMKQLLQTALGGTPQWIADIEGRQKYIVRKYLQGVDDQEDGGADKARLESSALPEDYVDVDGLSLYDFRGDVKMSRAELRQCDELERKRRALLSELSSAKSSLEVAYRTENYNNETGVGETKEGMPLGLLKLCVMKLRVMKLHFPEEFDVRSLAEVLVRVRLQSSSPAVSMEHERAPPVCPQIHNSATVSKAVEAEGAVFDQPLGPFAPIRTMHADVLFEVCLAGLDNLVLAEAALPLSELSNQVKRDRILALKIVNKRVIPHVSQLYVSAHFQFSKIFPLRESIVKLQEELGSTERLLSLLKSGQYIENSERIEFDDT